MTKANGQRGGKPPKKVGGDKPPKDGGAKSPSKWGKGKTDPDSWWQPGCPSPNPKGRPKGSKNQKTIWAEASGVKVTVQMDGVKKTMTKKELGYHQVAQKAAAGDMKAFIIQKDLDEKYDPVEAAPPTPEESAADFQTLEAWIALREKFKVFKEAPEEPPEAPSGGDDDDDSDDDGEDGDD